MDRFFGGDVSIRSLLRSNNTKYDLYIQSYQHYSIIPGIKDQSTFHLIRYTYVPGTCMYVMNTSHTWRPALGFSTDDVRSLVSRIFCRTARGSTYIRRCYTRAMACHTFWICFRSSTTYTLGTILRVGVVVHVAPDTTQWGVCGYTQWQPILTGAKHR